MSVFFINVKWKLLSCVQLFVIPWTPWNLPESSVRGIFQARILEWVSIPFSRGSSLLRDQTPISCTGRQILYLWATTEVLSYSSLLFSHSVVSDSLWPYESQHARPPCPSPSPQALSNSCTLSQWCHPTISSSVFPFFSCLNLSKHQGIFQWVSSSH